MDASNIFQSHLPITPPTASAHVMPEGVTQEDLRTEQVNYYKCSFISFETHLRSLIQKDPRASTIPPHLKWTELIQKMKKAALVFPGQNEKKRKRKTIKKKKIL